MHIWLNGEFVERSAARVSVFDAGLQHGVGLFETMLARNGRVFRAAAHLDRLAESARELLLTQRLQVDPLIEALQRTLERNELSEARVRLTVTGGDLAQSPTAGAPSASADDASDSGRRGKAALPTILIAAQPPTAYPPEFFDEGVVVLIADGRENPFHPMAGHKTLNYWPRIRALQHAAAKGASEAIWFTVSNHLASGSVSNIFLIKDGVLLTPIARGEEQKGAIPSCVLPGITRSAVNELAASMDIEVRKRMLDIEDLLAADEVFLTNSSWGVLPVIGVEREKIGDGTVGSLTAALREKWLALIDRETS